MVSRKLKKYPRGEENELSKMLSLKENPKQGVVVVRRKKMHL